MEIVKKSLSRDLKYVNLYTFADLHIGDKFCNIEKIINRIEDIKNDDNAFVILNGDLMNNAIAGSVSDFYGELLTPQQQMERVVELFEPIKHKILLVSEGNHEKRSYKKVGLSPSRFIAFTLGADFIEGAWLLFLDFGIYNRRQDRSTTYTIYGKHGTGGGKRLGSKMNRVEDMSNIIDADLIIHSHVHTPMTAPVQKQRIDWRNKCIMNYTQYLLITNAYLNFGGYGEEMGFAPSSMIMPKVRLSGTERQINITI